MTEEKIEQKQEQTSNTGFPDIKPGMWVKIHQRITETNPKGEEKSRIQIFEGRVLGRRGGNQKGATIKVYKESSGIGIWKIFPVHMPSIEKIEALKQANVRRAKLNYLPGYKKRIKETRLV